MRNRIIVLFALVFFIAINSTYAYDIEKQKVPTSSSQGLGRITTYMIEEASGWIGALVGQCVGFSCLGGIAMLAFGPPDSELFWKAVYSIQFFSGAMGATTGIVLTGKDGSRTGALIGSALGSLMASSSLWIMGPAFGSRASWLGLYEPWFGFCPYFSTCISTGAVIGYNYKALKSNKMELLQCLVGCAVTSIALNILIAN